MNHRDYLRSGVNMRRYAEAVGIPYVMLSKIKCARTSTPLKYFEAVVRATNGLVTYAELLIEADVFQEQRRLKSEKQKEINTLRAERREALQESQPAKAKKPVAKKSPVKKTATKKPAVKKQVKPVVTQKPEANKPSEQEKAIARAKARLFRLLWAGKEIQWSVANNYGVNNFIEFVESLKASGLKVRTGSRMVNGVRYELLKLAPSVLATVQGLGDADEPM